jgi:ribonucleotide reductase alpha subunit
MNAVKADGLYDLVDPVTHQVTGQLRARDVWDTMIMGAWRTGEPGVFFIDEANRYNPVPHLGQYEATNPCVTGDTLVATTQGLVPIADLCERGEAVPVTLDARCTSRTRRVGVACRGRVRKGGCWAGSLPTGTSPAKAATAQCSASGVTTARWLQPSRAM